MPDKNKNLLTRAIFKIQRMEVRTAPADVKSPGIITGYAAVYEELSVPLWGFREKIRAGAFAQSIKKNNVRALWNHNSDLVLGSTGGNTMTLAEDETGLRFEITMPDTQAGRDGVVSIDRRDVDGMSFGFNVRKQEWDETDPENVVRTLIDIDLAEISPTAFAAYPSTSVDVRSARDDFAKYREERQKIDQSAIAAAHEFRKREIELIELNS